MLTAQERGFTIKGYIPSLPDGTEVGIGAVEDSIVELAKRPFRIARAGETPRFGLVHGQQPQAR